MPPRRRQTPSAARLPASRLPLGTHLPGDDNALRPTSRNTDRSASSPRAASDTELATHIDIKNHPAYRSTDTTTSPSDIMSSPDKSSSDVSQPAHSMAEAKLRRQQERIQNAEAALAAPLHLDRREPSRGKAKTAWKPLDIAWDTAERKSDSVNPVQTRTNTIYGPAFSRETSLSRSLSSVSQQTTTTEIDRHDSITDSAGFQTYHGRRGRKHPDELGATEDTKPVERQATVEGRINKDEIFQVFRHELPGVEFLEGNFGFKDGQLQFIQHPNGDVSAHMWSHNRFEWSNIGHFSNIRKRIEGQLGADRLKGETGWQTLQRNTLAYFRVVAKQREQTTMGHDFGQAEIQQMLPQPAEVAKPPVSTHTASPTVSNSARQPSTARPPLFNPGQQQPVPAAQRPAQIPAQRPAAAKGFPFLSNEQAGKEDPFGASGIFLPTKEPSREKPAPVTNAQPTKPSVPPGLSSNLFMSNNPPAKTIKNETASTRPSLARSLQDANPGLSNLQGLFPLDTRKLSMLNIGQYTERRQPSQTSVASAGTPSRDKSATPASTREAMRDQLWKVSEFAQQRTNSQANIRTVLHDPFQNQSAKSEAKRTESYTESIADIPDDLRSESDTSQLFFPRGRKKITEPTHRHWIDSQPAINGTKPIPFNRREELLGLDDSVPDIDDNLSAPDLLSPEPEPEPTPIAQQLVKPANITKKSYDEELHDWWTSGNKFARQEDLYQSIKSLEMSHARRRPPSYTTTTPSTRPRPIGAPPSGQYSSSNTASPAKADEPPFNKIITRALIPVYENLAAYVEGPPEQRRDYWCQWSRPQEWAIDRSPNGNNSFFDDGWGQPPARVGRDPRYMPIPGELRFGGFSPGALGGSPRGSGLSGIPGLRTAMGLGGHGRF